MQKLTKEFIQNTLIRSDGRLNNRKIPENISLEEIYLIYNEMDIPKCENGHNLKFISFNKGYSNSCTNIECTKERAYKNRKQDYKKIHEKVKATKLERYGDEHFVNVNKRKETRLKEKENGKQYTINPVKNIEKLTKQFILREFIDNEKLDKFKFMEFFNCKETFMYKKLKELDIQYDKHSNTEKQYLKYHNINAPVCKNCSSLVKFMGFKRGYNECCSIKCSNKIKEQRAGKVNDTESFIKKAKEIHGDLYDYSLVEYKDSHTKVPIICKEHDVFYTKPYNHLNGRKCRECSYKEREKTIGWSRDRYKNKRTILYYIKLKKENLYKIGITSRSVEKRFSKEELKNIEILHTEIFEDGVEAFDKELKILQENRENKYKGADVLLSGNTELFTKELFLP